MEQVEAWVFVYSSKLGIMLKNKHEWNLVLLGAEAIASCFQGLEGRLFIKLEFYEIVVSSSSGF